ncbi:hypothetical protein GCM10023314_02650 [Algibacter agarivorans]|uniref:tRNA_anti-like n=1 Tax=Algibacter agarivorans TaxID=1109741 RepID=A0ABP9G9L4_9FLAO
MRKWIILFFLLITGFTLYKYFYQDHRDIQAEKANFIVTSTSMATEFSINMLEAESKYIDKTIEISGKVSEINNHDLTLDETIFCQFKENIKKSIKLDSKIKIKGRVIGYDDLLEQVKLDQCSITN